MTLRCFRCDTELEEAMPDDKSRIPWHGTVFTARGNYGSSVFDPRDESWLEINICDRCLLENSFRVLRCYPPVLTDPLCEPWNPLS